MNFQETLDIIMKSSPEELSSIIAENRIDIHIKDKDGEGLILRKMPYEIYKILIAPSATILGSDATKRSGCRVDILNKSGFFNVSYHSANFNKYIRESSEKIQEKKVVSNGLLTIDCSIKNKHGWLFICYLENDIVINLFKNHNILNFGEKEKQIYIKKVGSHKQVLEIMNEHISRNIAFGTAGAQDKSGYTHANVLDFDTTLKFIIRTDIELLKTLIDTKYLDLNIRDSDGRSLLSRKMPYLVYKLLVTTSNSCPIITLANNGKFNSIQYLPKYLADIAPKKITIDCSQKNKRSSSILYSVVDDIFKSETNADIILDQDLINFSASDKNSKGCTLLHRVCKKNQTAKIIKKVLALGVDPQVLDNAGKMAVDYLSGVLKDEIVEYIRVRALENTLSITQSDLCETQSDLCAALRELNEYKDKIQKIKEHLNAP